MNEFLSKITSDKIMFRGDLAAGGLTIASLIYLIIIYHVLPPYVPLFNQMPWGPERLGQQSELFLPIFISFSIFLLNLFFSYYFYEKSPLLARMFTATSILVSLITFIFLVRTTQLLL